MLVAHLSRDLRSLKARVQAWRFWSIVVAPRVHHTRLLLGGTHQGPPRGGTSGASRKRNPTGGTAQGEDGIPISGIAGPPVRQICGPNQRSGKMKPSADELLGNLSGRHVDRHFMSLLVDPLFLELRIGPCWYPMNVYSRNIYAIYKCNKKCG